MGKITLTVEGSTVGTVADGGGLVLPFEVSEADSARLITAMADFYQTPLAAAELPATIPNIVTTWFNDVIQTALRLTADYEKRQVSVAPITIT